MHRITNLTARPLHLMLRAFDGELQKTIIPSRNGSVTVPDLGAIAGHLASHGTVLVERVEEDRPALTAEAETPPQIAPEEQTSEAEFASEDDDAEREPEDDADSPPESPAEPETMARKPRRVRTSRRKETFAP